MQGAQILRNEAYIEVRCNDQGCSTTPPFGFAQGHESIDLVQDRKSFDPAQDRELVERPVEWQMDFLRNRQD